MADVHFSADLSTEKLDAAIKQSNKTVGEWAKNVEKSGSQIDQSLNKSSKSFKEAIKAQKDLIKSIEKDVKDLQKAYENAAPGKGSQAAYNDLKAAKRALTEEQGTLLGLQKQQIEANNKESDSANGIIGKLKGWALGLITVGAAMKIFKSIIDSTEKSAENFEKIVSASMATVGFFFKAIASGDWSNFSKGLDKAISGAIEFVETMDKINNRTNEQKIKSSEIDKKIAELRDQTYDKDESNNEARKKALIEIIALQKTKYNDEARLARQLYDANLKKAASDSGLAESQIQNFIKEYSSLEKLIEVGDRYNEITKMTRKAGMDPGYVATLLKERNALGINANAAGLYAKQISKVVPEARKQLAEFAVSANEAEAAFGQKNRRDKMQLAEVTNKIKSDQEASVKKAKEDAEKRADLNLQIIEQTKLLEKAVVSGNDNEVKAIAATIVALQQELYLREKLKNEAITSSIIREKSINKLKADFTTAFGLPIESTLAGKPTTVKESKFIPGTAMLTDAARKKQEQDSKKANTEEEKALQRQIDLRNQIVGSVTGLISQIGQMIGLDEKSMALLNASLDSFTQLATEDLPGAVMSMLSGIISQIPTAASKFEAQIEHINQLLEKQQRLIELSRRTGGQAEALQGEIDILLDQKALLERRIADAQNTMDKWFTTTGAKQKAIAIINESNVALDELNNKLIDAQQNLSDFITGGVTQETIADTIAQGFQEGKTSIDDFAEYMNQVLTNAIMDIFKNEILGDSITALTEQISSALADKVLTEEEKSNIDNQIKLIADANKQLWDELTGALDIGNISQPGLSGAIQRTITEDTANELSGLLRRMSDDERQSKDYVRAGVSHLVGIEANTAATVDQLKFAVAELKSIVVNTKPIYSGLGGG